MTDPEIHQNLTFSAGGTLELCPRCHRMKPLGTSEDGCKMCQSCYHVLHDMGPLPSDLGFI